MNNNETLDGQKVDRGVIVYHDEQILVSGIKTWKSETLYKISGLNIKSFPQVQDELDTHDWLWNVFDGKSRFTDNGRRIKIRWGSHWDGIYGSQPLKNMLAEELAILKPKFYETSEEETEDLKNGDWHSLVESHIEYFLEVIKDIMKRQVSVMPIDEARAVALHALCEFAKKISDNKEDLRARFRTSAYSWVKWFYQEALDQQDEIKQKNTRWKLKDRRTLNEFIKEFKSTVMKEPTVTEICNGLGWGAGRVDSTFSMFDFHINSYRDMNEEEMLYTVMDHHLTERQATIIEKSFGLDGVQKSGIAEIAEDLDVSFPTVQRDRAKAMDIIKEHLGFKYENRKG